MTDEYNTQIFNLVSRIDNLKNASIGFNQTVAISNDDENSFIHSVFNSQATELQDISKKLLSLLTKEDK